MSVTTSRRTALITGVAALTLALGTSLADPAYAGEQPSNGQGANTEQSGGGDKTGIYAAARITYSGSVAPNGGTGNVTSADVNWTPPPCWYAPYLGAKDFKKKTVVGQPHELVGHRVLEPRRGSGGQRPVDSVRTAHAAVPKLPGRRPWAKLSPAG
ncbi:hypothetical protein SVIOM342S_02936 [Streptomyces violaceorubidus]